ncbi:hypothetical protein [Variovorax sp. YR216]|uniref:hypothetical protein n=1 Tax=Variovorax sp. YR216 TaxID=1882828 RepID=UPI000896246F|nr:hypothetical protein [Variovorax sp. YR216]SEA65825.1 hypothetical protein SAMN05444680_1034 [Variovorax sp. YR216]
MIASVARQSARACTAALLTLALLPLTNACADSGKTEKKAAGRAAMTTAPMKANGSGVAVKYRVEGTPRVGAATSVVLTLDGVTDPAGASLRLQAEGGVALGATATTVALPAGAATTLTIDVTPTAEGIGYVHVFTTQYGATSATSIPIQVGKTPAQSPASDLKQSPDGERIRSMQVK